MPNSIKMNVNVVTIKAFWSQQKKSRQFTNVYLHTFVIPTQKFY